MQSITDNLIIRVECYAGYRAEERPLRFFIRNRCVTVSETLDQWQGPDYRYFKVRGDDKGIYILRHSSAEDTWELTMFDSGELDETRLSST